MNGPSDAAVEAAAEAIYAQRDGTMWDCEMEPVRERYGAYARAALSAALPIIREELAREIEAEIKPSWRGPMYSGMKLAARFVRGGEGA